MEEKKMTRKYEVKHLLRCGHIMMLVAQQTAKNYSNEFTTREIMMTLLREKFFDLNGYMT